MCHSCTGAGTCPSGRSAVSFRQGVLVRFWSGQGVGGMEVHAVCGNKQDCRQECRGNLHRVPVLRRIRLSPGPGVRTLREGPHRIFKAPRATGALLKLLRSATVR